MDAGKDVIEHVYVELGDCRFQFLVTRNNQFLSSVKGLLGEVRIGTEKSIHCRILEPVSRIDQAEDALACLKCKLDEITDINTLERIDGDTDISGNTDGTEVKFITRSVNSIDGTRASVQIQMQLRRICRVGTNWILGQEAPG